MISSLSGKLGSLNYLNQTTQSTRSQSQFLDFQTLLAGSDSTESFDADSLLLAGEKLRSDILTGMGTGDPSEESEMTPGIPPTPVEYGHTLTDLIGGQTSAGFKICDFFEDCWGGNDPLSNKTAVFIATRAKKP